MCARRSRGVSRRIPRAEADGVFYASYKIGHGRAAATASDATATTGVTTVPPIRRTDALASAQGDTSEIKSFDAAPATSCGECPEGVCAEIMRHEQAIKRF